jgi:hypothetical protein
MGLKILGTSEGKEARLAKKQMLIAKKANKTLEDRAARLGKLKKSRGKRKALAAVQERDVRLQQMIYKIEKNETLQ